MINIDEKYNAELNISLIEQKVLNIRKRSTEIKDKELLKKIFSFIDLTSLGVNDTTSKIQKMVQKVNHIPEKFSELPNVAAICVYPVFISLVKDSLSDKTVKIASVGASFPSSQTFTDVKMLEIERIIGEGADEIDIVLPVGKFLEGDYEEIFKEISKIKALMGKKHLKVILETATLEDPVLIRRASLLCLEAGADFIKTSTGKNDAGASPEALYIMCEAVKDFHASTGEVRGIKPAGGISDSSTAIMYYLIVNEVLGNEWLNSDRFRIGASRLANNLLGEKYF